MDKSNESTQPHNTHKLTGLSGLIFKIQEFLQTILFHFLTARIGEQIP